MRVRNTRHRRFCNDVDDNSDDIRLDGCTEKGVNDVHGGNNDHEEASLAHTHTHTSPSFGRCLLFKGVCDYHQNNKRSYVTDR